MEEDDLQTTANSELRFLTLELMRLAQKSGRGFQEVAEEFISNTVMLQGMVAGEEESRAGAKGKKGSSAKQK